MNLSLSNLSEIHSKRNAYIATLRITESLGKGSLLQEVAP